MTLPNATGGLEALLAWLPNATAAAAVAAGGVLVVQHAFGRWLSPAWRYRLWGVVVLRLLLPAAPASPTSVWNLDVAAAARRWVAAPAPVVPARTEATIPAPPSGLRIVIGYGPVPPDHLLPAPVPSPRAAPVVAAPAVPAPPRWPAVLAGAWLAGVAVLLSRLVVTNVAFARRLRTATRATDPDLLDLFAVCCQAMGISRPPPILVTPAVHGPAAAGAVRPRILLPPGLLETLSPAERRIVLLHELAHVRRRDVAANWGLAVLQAVHWFNPIVWWAFARLKTDREAARDAMVLAAGGDAPPARAADHYARTLLKLAERVGPRPAGLAAAAGLVGIVTDPPTPFAPGLFGRRATLRRRLHMIARFPETAGRRFKLLGPVLLVAVGCGFLTGPKTLATAEPDPAQPTKPGQPKLGPETQPAASEIETVAILTAEARRLTDDGKYAEALAVVKRILRIDPRDEYARGIRLLLEDRAAGEEKKIPYDDILRRPGDWPDLRAVRDRVGHQEKEGERERQALLAQLGRKLPEVKFDGVPFTDVIDFFRDTTKTNIFVNWKAIDDAGIDRKAPVTARLYNARFAKALQIILDSVSTPKSNLKFVIDEGVITVSTAADFARNVLTRVYDVRDLVTVIPDFGPPLAQPNPPVPSTRPATSQPTAQGRSREQLVKELVLLITETVDPESWREAGGNVGNLRELSGQLVVTQTPENHRSIVMLLERMRELRGIQITVETRFFTCDEAVMKDLIAEWRKAGGNDTTPHVVEGGRFTKARIGAFLNEAQVEQVLRAVQADQTTTMVSAPRMTLFNGQRAFVKVAQSKAYVQDYTTIQTADGGTRYEPVVGDIDTGLMLDLTAAVSADRKYATLTLHPRISALKKMNDMPWSGRPAGSNLTVQVPDSTTTEAQTTASVRDGDTILLGGLIDPDRILTFGAAGPQTRPAATTRPAGDGKVQSLFILAKPRIILHKEGEQKTFPLLNQQPQNGR